jgi:hypothetical protein
MAMYAEPSSDPSYPKPCQLSAFPAIVGGGAGIIDR